jgi:GTP-binding protein HflX
VLSSREPADVAALRERILGFFERGSVEVELHVPYAKQKLVGELHSSARVLSEAHDEHGTLLRVRAKPDLVERIQSELRRGQTPS